jgi:hypothetical protein
MESGKEIAMELIKTIQPVARNLVGRDLVTLFKMIDKYGITDESCALLMSVAPNLMTIESPKIFQWGSLTKLAPVSG